MPPASRIRLVPLAATLLAMALAFLAALDIHRKVESFQPVGVALDDRGVGFLVRSVEEPGTGLLPGDRISDVDGASPTSIADLEARLRGRESSRLLVIRGPGMVTVEYERPPLAIDVPYLLLAAAGIGYLAIGLFVVVRSRRPPTGLFFLWCLASAAVYLLTFVPSLRPTVAAQASFLVEELARVLLPALTVHLFLTFPAPAMSSRARRRLAPFLYLPSAALGALQADLVLNRGAWFFGTIDRQALAALDRLELLWIGIGSLVALAALVRAFLRADGWEARRQVQGITLGVALGYLPFVVLYAAPFTLGWHPRGWTTVLAVAPLLLVPLALAWAILRYRLWDLELAVRRAVSYTVTLLLGVLTFSLAHLAIDRGLPEGEILGRNLLTFLAGLFIAGILVPTERAVRRRIEHWQYRETYESRRALRRLGRTLLEERNLQRLARRLVDGVREAFRADPVVLYLVEPGRGLRLAVAEPLGDDRDALPLAVLSESAWSREVIASPTSALPDLDESLWGELRERGVRYAFPLALRGEPVGLLLTGLRDDGYPLNGEELDLLRGVLDQTALAVQNARLVETLHDQLDEMERLRVQSEQILTSSPVGIAVLDATDRIVMANESFARLAGSEPSRVANRRLADVLPVRPIPEPEEGIVEAAYCDAGGGEHHYQLSTARFPGDPSGLRVLVAHDVTDKIAMEHALEQKERLAALGMLAAGLAHEVNTPITGISSYAQLLLDDMAEEDPRRDILRKMERQTFRASRIVNNLLEFARNRRFDPQPLDLRRIVEDALEAAGERLDQAPIRVEWEPPTEPCTVLGGEGELQQVLVNLIGNGCDAMAPAGGTLRLAIETTEASYRVTVADQGCGIPTAELERIFQPFYSTKAGQGGTGLGLAISRQIVERHGGSLGVESDPGVGTRFALELPRFHPTTP
jgi:hypothetical protein